MIIDYRLLSFAHLLRVCLCLVASVRPPSFVSLSPTLAVAVGVCM